MQRRRKRESRGDRGGVSANERCCVATFGALSRSPGLQCVPRFAAGISHFDLRPDATLATVVMEDGASVAINTRLLALQRRGIGTRREIRGLMKLKRDNAFFTARAGDRIDTGDTVKVEDKSSVVIGNGRQSFRGGENSIIHFPARPANERPGEIEIQSGTILFQAPAGGDFKVKTPSVRAVITG